MRNEKETRLELIDPKLKLAGWKINTEKYVIEKNTACIETPVTGMVKTIENPSGNGFVDYVLFGEDCKPLAVIEAKKSIINEEQGRVQACLYADCLEKKYGVRPIIYYTNGYSIKIIDGIYPPRTVFGFHKKDELEYLIQKRQFKLSNIQIDNTICDRYYQHEAIQKVIEHLNSKHSRSLVVLATGTGKTRVSCALSDIFIKNNYVKRILFLADRVNLVKQAKEDTFEKYLSTIPMSIIADGQKESDDENARIVFSTYQSMISIIRDITKCKYGIGHFDLIIVDEAHRSLFNKYAEIFSYFDALMIGLTATPRNDINKSTYKVFDLANSMPNYEYDVIKGVKDGYLTYYRALDRTPDILKNGLKYSDLSIDEQEQYEDLFTDDEGEIPESIDGEKFYSVITNIDTIREVLKCLMEEGIKVNNGDVLGKTIIFARNHPHAVLIQDTFRKLYPEKCLTNSKNGTDYCVIIDNKIKYNEVLQREFKNKQDIRIVISVDMLDTGVDIPEVVNLVFFKRVLSKIKFWQMIGRGTRICKNIKVLSPSKAYFERLSDDSSRQLYDDKQGFLIFDICNVFPFFKLKPDGREDKSDTSFSLYQKIYLQKVELYKVMINNTEKLDDEEKEYIEKLKNDLISEIVKLNRNYIGVINNLEYVEKYSKIEAWLNFNQNSYNEVKNHIARNIQGEIDLDSSRSFDYLCYKFASNKITKSKDFKKSAKTLFDLSNILIKYKMHIGEVKEHEETLKCVASNNFMNTANVVKIESIRSELRELMRYIDDENFKPIISDFDDKISSSDDAVETDVDFNINTEDFMTLSEKIIKYIFDNKTDNFILKTQQLKKHTKEEITKFKKTVIKLARTAEEYNSLFKDDNDLIHFVRKNIEFDKDAVKVLINNLKSDGLNDEQIDYAKRLLMFVSQNGKFDRRDLLREELNFQNVFNSTQIALLISHFEKIFI